MFTLRIIFTGLIAFGPMVDSDEPPTGTAWALMPETTSSMNHFTYVKWGCTSDGLLCAATHKVQDQDIRVLIDGTPLEDLSGKFRVDYSFREHVVDISEITSDTHSGHFECGRHPHLKIPKLGERLTPIDDLLNPTAPTRTQNLVNARVFLTAGGVLNSDHDGCDGEAYCGGKVLAREIPTCHQWTFSLHDQEEPKFCTRMATQIVVELLVEDTTSVGVRLVKHADPADVSDHTVDNPSAPSKVLELWISHSPDTDPGHGVRLNHYLDLYNMFAAAGLDYRRTPISSQTASCNDLPGTFPIKCPVMQFK